MKNKNKAQQTITAISAEVAPISNEVLMWGRQHLTSHAVFHFNKVVCMECGADCGSNSGMRPKDKITCVKCGAILRVWNEPRARVLMVAEYITVIDTIGEWQLVRVVWLQKNCEKFKKPSYYSDEVMRHWVSTSGAIYTEQKRVNSFTYYCDAWLHHSALDIRGRGIKEPSGSKGYMRFRMCGYLYPKVKLIGELRRNGLRAAMLRRDAVVPQLLMPKLLSDNNVEMALKCKQYPLVEWLQDSKCDYWASVRICCRHGYIIKDVKTWMDMMQMMEAIGMDLRNPALICPTDLMTAHNRVMERKVRIELKRKADERRAKHLEWTKEYRERMAKWLELQICIAKANIVITPMQDIDEFEHESKVLGHCAYSSEYYNREDSLVLSAKLNGVSIETIEVDLGARKVVQNYGHNNKPTPYSKRIRTVVNSYFKQFKPTTK